jgi:DNA topoisomerase-1
MANLVIVESPAKALTIKGYLGSNYKVVASVGHIRDLPKSTLGIDIENGFEPHYINIRGKGDVIKQLKKEAKTAGKIFLATDPDREGEAISWHLALTLGIPLDKMCRATFNELTKSAVKEAIKSPRLIDENLVNSQQARRILDRIVGYKLSPFLWKNVKSGLSAGRVQSVATRLIVDREREIRAFVPREYWTIEPELLTEGGQTIRAKFYGDRSGRIQLACEADAMRVVSAIRGKTFSVASVKHAQKTKVPPAPFMTSTLLQEATRKLGFQSQRVMKVAQELYEGIDLGSEFGGVQGLITYMRTDSLRVSTSSQEAALALIGELYGDQYVPETPRVYKSKADAQDAHEAIRPANVSILPKQIRKLLTSDQYRLYKLIWERFMASQMEAAVLSTVSIETECEGYLFRTSGYTVRFNGYLALYDSEDEAVEDENGEGIDLATLPELREKETLSSLNLNSQKHFTEAPARYNDGSLINVFKESGIGRPSTYATIISTIISRSYVKRDGKNLVPTPLGEITTDLMMEHFPEIVDYEFTSQMEDKLDGIEQGGSSIADVLGDFYRRFACELEKAESNVTKTEFQLPA